MKTTIKFLDADLVNDIVTLMVGIKQVEIRGNDYRTLLSIAKDWRSGLEFITNKNGSMFKFNSDNAHQIEGKASATLVIRIINNLN